MSNMITLFEDEETSRIKYISFIGESNTRFDLAIVQTDRFFGKKLVIHIQSGRIGIIGQDDLEEPGFLEETYHLSEEEVKDLYQYLVQEI
ncbi:DUF3055 domain-containing protein [Tepidibacillus fermentans]|uniref:DUF3055 family protein n=1 Tax=Tepidibacillus fermentans TaxID=1281767 RepID=A0A4R3KK56_9BACI|nr:DUF3055 domain-containing protein [Tepidibacillus fermentans]TCS83110.1 DUF3055 family protein [Tepidibacillus fermentans]